MNKQQIEELFQQHSFLFKDFNQETDELIIYRLKKEILYAFSIEKGSWKCNFIMTNCAKRWVELIHPLDGTVVEQFIERIENGEKDSQMVCRFGENGKYNWYFTYLVRTENTQLSEDIAIGYRRNLSLESESINYIQLDTMDALTNTYNKKSIKKRINENIQKYKEYTGVFCVLDLGQFQAINQLFGYKIGDELLCELVKIIRENVSSADMIGRIGTDIFVIYMTDLAGEKNWKKAIGNILVEVKQLYKNSPLYHRISISVGAALYPKDGNDYDSLYEKAKEAWNYAKLSQGEGFEIYQQGMLRHTWQENAINEELCYEEWQKLDNLLSESPISDITKDLFATPSHYEESIKVLIKRLCARYDLSTIRIYEYIDDSKNICCTYEWCQGNCDKQVMEICSISDENVSGKIVNIHNNGTVHIYDDKMFVREYGNKGQKQLPQIKNGVVVELIYKNCYLGRMTLLDFEKTHEWSMQKLAELEWVGHVLSIVLYSGERERSKKADWEVGNIYDPLTRLYRIEKFLEKTYQILVENPQNEYLLVYSDISNFKYVNEMFGYDVGDNILRGWADMLRKEIPNTVISGRVCYDYIVGLRKIEAGKNDEEILFELNQAKVKIEHRMKSLYEGSNFTLNTGAYRVGNDVKDLSAALAYANMARKLAKQSSTRCMLYTDEMREKANREIELVASLDDAIEAKEFVVYLQPKIGCVNQKIIGAEALVRWIKKNGEFIYPDEFITVFEKYGCIRELDYYVYEEVFRFIRKRMDKGKPIVPVSLNVSRAHMVNTALISKIEYLLEVYKIPTRAIEFEITESLYMEKLPGLEAVLEYFQEKGFTVSMDDFGTGYSSLNAISTMPVDVIKMDRIFMKQDGLRKNDKIIITHIITMANELQKKVLCEGVETVEQKNFITSVGCDSWQGYLFSKPVPIIEFENIMEESDIEPV